MNPARYFSTDGSRPGRTRSVLPVLLLALLAGCGSSGPAADEPQESSPFQRVVNPFPVYDSAGTEIAHPFLGGFNVPRPQFVDIDGDGDPDLFVQEQTDELMFLENADPASETPLEWRSDVWRDLSIGEWFRFVDLDQDGDFDLLAEQPYSYIRYYRNDGSPSSADFTLVTDTLKDASGTPIFSDRQNIPNVTDIDCDGLLDLFIGRLDGTLMRYESVGRDSRGIPQFELVTRRFEGIEIVNQFGTLHGANTMAFVDIDNDGDQDLFWGDFFESGLLLIENEGTCSNPMMEGEPQLFPPSDPVQTSGYNAPTFGDWKGDGNLDLFVGVLGGAYDANRTTVENFLYYDQAEDGTFSLQTRQFLNTIDIGNESMPAVGDLDGDGDTDLLLANKIEAGDRTTSAVYRFENRSEEGGAALHLTGKLDVQGVYHYAPALGDLDGDGRDDLLLGMWNGDIAYHRNTGEGFEPVSESFLSLSRGSNSTPVLGDIDGDGDLDLFVGSSGGDIHFFRNRGTSSEPQFEPESEAFPDVGAEHRSVPELHDIDGDGDLDLFVGTRSEGVLFFRNTGTPEAAQFEREPLPAAIDAPRLATPRFTDLDGDGDADFLSGGVGGGLVYYLNSDR